MKLPYPEGELLAYIPPEYVRLLGWLLFVLLLIPAMAYALRYLKNFFEPQTDFQMPESTRKKRNKWLRQLQKIREKNAEPQFFREACLQASVLVKHFITENKHVYAEPFTAADFHEHFPETNVDRYFKKITPILFREEEPSSQDVNTVFEGAATIVREGVRK